MKNIKTIIFDFDGVLADTIPYTFEKVLEFLKEEKKIKEKKDVIGQIRSKTYLELLKEWKISWLKIPFMMKRLKEIQEELYDEIQNIKIFPGIKTLINGLEKRDIRLMILSSNLEKNVKKFLSLNNIKIFREIDCGSNVFGKGHALKKFITKYELNREETIYIGDEVRDIEACHKNGIKIICVSWGLNNEKLLKDHGADFIVKYPKEILEIIKKD